MILAFFGGMTDAEVVEFIMVLVILIAVLFPLVRR